MCFNKIYQFILFLTHKLRLISISFQLQHQTTPEEEIPAPPPQEPEPVIQEPEVVQPEPEVNISFPDVKFPTPEIKVIQQEEQKVWIFYYT